jgi:hypothetical protein
MAQSSPKSFEKVLSDWIASSYQTIKNVPEPTETEVEESEEESCEFGEEDYEGGNRGRLRPKPVPLSPTHTIYHILELGALTEESLDSYLSKYVTRDIAEIKKELNKSITDAESVYPYLKKAIISKKKFNLDSSLRLLRRKK